ncbi:MAG: RNA polymerase sigma factor [Chlamydiae bacterium]|nr:RNA polymerase sigma factor [Chlamydiota bacterium]
MMDVLSLKDDQLIQEALGGNESSFEELVRRYKVGVMKVVYRYARDAHEVDDMAQEVFLKAYFSLSQYRCKAPFQHWLSRIATRVALDHVRWRSRRKENFFSEMAEEDQGEWLEGVLSFLSSESNQESEVNQRDRARLLESILGELSPRDQLVLKAMELEGQTVREISEMTGWGESAIKVRLFRARKKMRKILGKRCKQAEIPL